MIDRMHLTVSRGPRKLGKVIGSPGNQQVGYLERTSLAGKAAQELVALIRNRGLRPGDAMPSSREMAAGMGINMTTLREALRRLEGTGTVELRHGSGTYVGPNIDRTVVANPTSPDPTGMLAIELIDARLAIEPQIAALAAENRNTEHLARLEIALESAMAGPTSQSNPDPSRPGRNFHRDLAAASGNQILFEVIDSLLTRRRQEQAAIRSAFSDRERDLNQHKALLAAVARGKSVQASQLMHSHLLAIREVAVAHFHKPQYEEIDGGTHV